jgi:hypothetical protein
MLGLPAKEDNYLWVRSRKKSYFSPNVLKQSIAFLKGPSLSAIKSLWSKPVPGEGRGKEEVWKRKGKERKVKEREERKEREKARERRSGKKEGAGEKQGRRDEEERKKRRGGKENRKSKGRKRKGRRKGSLIM